jgi:predicted CoA-binding protein
MPAFMRYDVVQAVQIETEASATMVPTTRAMGKSDRRAVRFTAESYHAPVILDDPKRISDLLSRTRRIAVLGIKTEAQSDQPAFYVPQYLVRAGLEVVPVPVYYPEVTTILGQPVHRTLASIPGDIDLVDVFRRPKDLAARTPKPFYIGYGASDPSAADGARALASLLRAAKWPVEERAHPFGHGARAVYLEEAFATWAR